jgi:hypothetical protein
MRGQLHLIKCRCVLPQFKDVKEPQPHQFVVFSVIDDSDNVIVKSAQCNNCGTIHKVVDICKSEIMNGKEKSAAVMSVEDIKISLPPNLVSILDRHQVGLPVYEQAQFILENKKWGEFILLTKEEEKGTKQGKYLRVISESFFKVDTFSRTDVVTPE